MVQRTVSVGLVANVSNYVANMNRAAEATRKTAAAAVGSEKQLRSQGEVYGKIGTAALGAGALAAAGLAVVVKATAEYGAKMAQLQSLSKASAADMKKLSAAAMEQGKAYGFSASQVADAEIELTKAGFNTAQILGGGLKAALTLAAAGQMDVAEATSITTVALTQFKLKASDLPHVADLLAAGADKALGSVGDLGEALSNGGTAAAAMKIPLQDTVGVLAAFANAGTIGAEGGTQLKSMLLALENQTPKSKKALDELGISVYDQQGKFVGLANLAGQLSDKLGKKSVAERNAATATIFGSYAQNAANVLIEEGSKGISGWITKVNEYGFANAQAAGKMNSLAGDAQKLSATFDTSLIKAGSGANDVLRGLVKTATSLVGAVGDVPAPILSTGLALTTAAGAVALVGGAALVATPKIAAFKVQLAQAGVTGKSLGVTFAKGAALSVGIAAVTAGLAGMAQQGQATKQQLAQTGLAAADQFKDLDKLFNDGAIGQGKSTLKDALRIEGLESTGNKIASLNGLIGGLSAGVLKNEGAFDALGQQLSGLAQQNLPAAQSGFAGIVSQYRLTSGETSKLLGLMPAYRDTLAEVAAKAGVLATDSNLVAIAQNKGAASAKVLAYQQREASAASAEQSSALQVLAGAADDGAVSVSALKRAIEGLDGGQVSASEAAIAMQQAIDAATVAAKKGARGLDIHTAAGQENQHTLNDIVTTAEASAKAYLDAGGDAAGAAKIVRDARKSWIDNAAVMLGSRAAAVKLAAAYFNIPKTVRTHVLVDGIDPAKADLATLQAQMGRINGLRATVYVNAVAQGVDPAAAARAAKQAAQNATHRAEGGAIEGPGPKGKDSVNAVLAPGEHVLTADDVDAMGGQANVYRFRSALHMASGGAVSDAIKAQQNIASEAKGQAAFDLKRIAAAQRKATAARKQADQLQNRYEGIAGDKAHRAAKAAAKRAAEAAAKRAEAAEKQVQTEKDFRDKALQARADANTATVALRNDREDFVSQQRRGVTDPLTYVDQLRSMSRDANYSQKNRTAFYKAANQYETALVNLAKKSEDAAAKLADLQQSADSMRSSITQSIASGYQLSGLPTADTTKSVESGWRYVNGIRVKSYSDQTVSGAPTVTSIGSFFAKGAKDSSEFASDLKRLAARGVNPALLAEIAGYGVAQGSPIAKALLAATSGQIASINRDYGAIQRNAASAAGTVTDANYKALIDAADASAKEITAQIAADGEKLRKLIARAFGLKGYAGGTISATPGLHPVAENGMEIVTGPSWRNFRGGERVLTYGQTQAYIRGGGPAAGRPGATRLEVAMPQSMTLVDAGNEVIGRFRVVARDMATQVLDDKAHAIGVQLQG